MSSLASEKPLPEAIAGADNLPSLPTVAVKVLRLCESDNSTLDDLAGAVEQDPALAAKMLKLSNSSLFSLGQRVTTLKHASMVLGMKTVKLMSLSFSLAEALPKDGSARFDYQEYWKRSLTAAVAGRSLAQLVDQPCRDEAFLCGMLSHLGQLVLAECMGDVYSEVVDAAKDRWPTAATEEYLLGFNHSDVSGTLLRSWHLPDLVTLPVGYMFRPDELPDDVDAETRELTRIMSLCGHVVGLLCDADGGAHLKAFHEDAAKHFGLAEASCEPFLMGLEVALRETAAMLSIELRGGEKYNEIIGRARMQMAEISLSATADLNFAERRARDLETENRTLGIKATTDKLTGLPNRAAFDERLAAEVTARIDGGVPRALGVVMMDIDNFKAFNDTYGHLAGDAVLKMVGRILIKLTRESDFCARYGGEEFSLILPQTTPHLAKMIANRVREAIETEVVEFEDAKLQVTASFGAACIGSANSHQDISAVIKLADKFLYKAKANGRNRVELYPQIRLPGPRSRSDE